MEKVSKELRSFAALEKSANRWVSQRKTSAVHVPDAEDEDGLRIRRDKYLRMRQRTEAELRDQKDKRKRAAQLVREALRVKQDSRAVSRPLRRFDTKMIVVLVYHSYNPQTRKEQTKRMMVVMEDKLKYEKCCVRDSNRRKDSDRSRPLRNRTDSAIQYRQHRPAEASDATEED